MQKICNRLRTILLLAVLILLAGAAASIMEAQLSPQGPRVIGKLFGAEAQAAGQIYYLEDYAESGELKIRSTAKSPEDAPVITQRDPETNVNINYIDISQEGSSYVELRSINVTVGYENNYGRFDNYCSNILLAGDNIIRTNNDSGVDLGYGYNATKILKSASSKTEIPGLTLINTNNEKPALDIHLSTYDGSTSKIDFPADDVYLNLSNLLGVPEIICSAQYGKLAAINVTAPELKGQTLRDVWLNDEKETEASSSDNSKVKTGLASGHINDDGTGTLWVQKSINGYIEGLDPSNNFGLISAVAENGQTFKGKIENAAACEGRNSIRYKGEATLKQAPEMPNVIAATAKQINPPYGDDYKCTFTVDSVKGQEYSIYEQYYGVLNNYNHPVQTVSGTGEPIVLKVDDLDLINTAEIVYITAKYENPTAGQSSLESICAKPVACNFKDATLKQGAYNQGYSDSVNQDEHMLYTLAADSKLPKGLSLNTKTGEVSGTAQEAGTFSFKVESAVNTDDYWGSHIGYYQPTPVTATFTLTIDKTEVQTPAAPTVDTIGKDYVRLKENEQPDAGTVASLAGATYQYAISSVDGKIVNSPVWQDSTEFTSLQQGTAYTFAARFKETKDTFVSASSAWSSEINTKVAVAVPSINLDDGNPCATAEGAKCQITSDATHQGEEPAEALLNVGDRVTYTITPCKEHSFRKVSINGQEVSQDALKNAKGVITTTYTVRAKDHDITAKAVMGTKQVIDVAPMTEYQVSASDPCNASAADLTSDINARVKVRYEYDNGTVLENQETTWSLDSNQNYSPKGGTWKYSGTQVGTGTPHLDAVVTPVAGQIAAVPSVTKPINEAGYKDAAALGLPSQVEMTFENGAEKAMVDIRWGSLPSGFGKTEATFQIAGQVENAPAWATFNNNVSVDIAVVDADILTITRGISVKDKVYDGTTSAELVVDEGGIILTDATGTVVRDIKADASKAKATFKTADAGKNIGVTVEGVKLTSDVEGFDPDKYVLDFGAVNANIEKVTPEFTGPTADNSVTYGAPLKDIGLKGGKVKIGKVTSVATFKWKNSDEIPNVENKGYTAVYVPDDPKNVNPVETTVAVTVNKKALKVTPDAKQEKIYGDADPVLSYSTDQVLVEGNEMTGALSRSAGDAVGSYEILKGSLSAGSNYDLSVVRNVQFKINQRPVTPVATVEDREYKAGDTSAKASIALPEVLAADQNDVTAVNYQASFATDEIGSPRTVTVTGITLSGNKAANYNLTTNTTTTRAAITPAWPKITKMPTAKGITYGQALSETKLEGGTAVDKNKTSVVVPGHFEWADPTLVPAAGNYNAKVKFVPDDQTNYGTAAVETPVVVAVAKRDVIVTPDANQTKTYSESDPEALTYTIPDGALLDDGSEMTGALTREPGEDVGNYRIINNDLSAGSNYNIVLAEQNFTITQKKVTVTAEADDRVYISGDLSADVTLTVNGAIAEDHITASCDEAYFKNDTVGNDKTVTVTGIALKGEKAGNYLLPEEATTVTTKATIFSATAEIETLPTVKNSIIYGQPLSEAELEGGKVVDSVTHEEVAGTFDWKTPDQVLTEIGDIQANVVFTPDDLGVYGKIGDKVTVSVGKKAIDVAPVADQTKVFGSSDPNSYGFVVSDETPLVGEDKLLDVLTRAEGEDVGEYAYSLTPSAAEHTHYTITLKDADTIKFAITKATPEAPAMPVLKGSTSGSVTLETIEVTDAVALKAGAAVEYGLIEGDNQTKWQAEPVFEGLEGDTVYRFTARYAATDNTEASAESAVLEVKTPTGGIVVEAPAVTGVPEGTEGVTVTADKLDQAVNAGETVTFTLTGNKAKEGSYVPYGFTINGEAVEVGKMDEETRTCTVTYTVQDADVEKGSLDAEALFTLLGDINDDGTVDAGDALLIQRAAGGLGDPLSDEKKVAADVNLDGAVDAGDALLIKRFAAGLIEAL